MTRPPMHTSTWVIMILLTLLALPFDIFIYDYAFNRRLPSMVAGMAALVYGSQLAFTYGFSRVIEWILRRAGKLDWLQLHLSTCIVLMFAASIIVGLSLRPTPSPSGRTDYGWPFTVLRHRGDTSGSFVYEYGSDWLYWSLTLNIAITIAILFAIGFICERRYRKPAAEKVAPEHSTL